MARLDIFEHRFGDDVHPGYLSKDGENTLGEVGLRMLNCIQTVADALADEQNVGYRVSFADTASAYTLHGEKRISISGLPLTKAPKGTPLRDIAAVLTGFVVHEIGHTKRVGILDAVRKAWPDKKLPGVLGNIVEDVVLEARTIERYAGFVDVFDPTFEWVARETCPTHPLKWDGSTGHKVNLVGQIVRYRPFVTFTADAETQSQLRWWDEWGAAITAAMTPAEGVEHVRKALAHIHEPSENEPEPTDEDGEPGDEPGGDEPGEGKDGTEGGDPGIPDEEDDDDTEGDDGDGDDSEDGEDGTEGGGSETDAPPIDDGDDTEGEGEGNGEGDSDDESEDSDSKPKGEGEDTGHGNAPGTADTQDRVDAPKGTNDTDGAGGTGQSISEADPDAGLDETELDKTLDEFNDEVTYGDRVLQDAVEVERTTSRFDAGIHGKMRVIFK